MNHNSNQSEIIKEPIRPNEKRYVINDATVEKVGMILSDDILCKAIVCDELIGFINNLEKDKGISDKAFYLQSWNGNGSYKVERVTRDSIHIPNLCLSIIGNMTPQNIDAYFSKYFDGFKNDGFIQRLQLMVFPDLSNKQHKHIDRQENQELASKMMLIVDAIDRLDFIDCDKIDTFDGKYYFKFAPDTQEFYIKWYLNLLNKENKREETEILIEHFTKYTKLVPALALIFDIIISATNNQKQGLISIDAMKMAIRYSDYLKLHARKVYGRRKIKDKDIIGSAMQLLTRIKNDNRYQNSFSVRDIERNEWSGLTNKQILKSAITYLEQENYIIAEKTEKSVLYKLGFEKIKQNDKSTDSTDS